MPGKKTQRIIGAGPGEDRVIERKAEAVAPEAEASANIGTPYDDVFKTMLVDHTPLIIPLINEAFGEDYTGEERIELLPVERFID